MVLNTFKFKDIVIGEEGLLKGPFGSDLKKSLYVPKGTDTYKVYLQENILNETNDAGNHYISKEYYETKMKRYAVKNNDFIVTCDGTLGEIFQLKDLSEPGIISSSLLRITLNNDLVDDDYFYYLWKAILKKQLITQGNNSVLKHLPGINVIRELKISLPNMKTQKRIGRTLRLIDSKIENNTRINSTLESLAKTIYNYWFLQYEFPNEDGKPYKSSGGKMVYNEELKREIPEGWEVKEFKDFAHFVKGRIPNSDLFKTPKTRTCLPYITIDAANNAKPQYCESEDMVLLNGETIMVMDGAASGDVYIGKNGILGSTFSKIVLDDEDISNNFIYMLLKTYKPQYTKANTGSTVPHANAKFISKMKFAIPKSKNLFSSFDKIFMQISLNSEETQRLIALRDFLLPILMNGQAKVE